MLFKIKELYKYSATVTGFLCAISIQWKTVQQLKGKNYWYMLHTNEPKDILLSKRIKTQNIVYLYALACKSIETGSK